MVRWSQSLCHLRRPGSQGETTWEKRIYFTLITEKMSNVDDCTEQCYILFSLASYTTMINGPRTSFPTGVTSYKGLRQGRETNVYLCTLLKTAKELQLGSRLKIRQSNVRFYGGMVDFLSSCRSQKY